MSRVYTDKIAVYIWGGKNSDHKQAKLPKNVALNTIGEVGGRYELEPEHTKAVIEIYDPKRDSDYTKYSSCWVEKSDVAGASAPLPPPVPGPGDPPPPVGDVGDEAAGRAFVTLTKWFVALIKS